MALNKKLIHFISSPRYVLPFPLLNKMGLQRLRIFFKRQQSKASQIKEVAGAVEVLNRDGILVLPNFLSPDDFENLKSDIQRLISSKITKSEVGKEGGKIQWLHGNFPETDEYSLINRKFRDNSFIKQVVSSYTRRNIRYLPQVIYQNLKAPLGYQDADDVQTVLHADRFYKTIKIFYTVSDHSKENGAFWYSPGSQVMTPERINFEQEYSVRCSLERTGKSSQVPENFFKYGRSVIHPNLEAKFPPVQYEAPANSLMIVDVSGFHKRGLIGQDKSRETIRMIYHYIHAPLWSQHILAFFKKSPGRYLC